VDAFATARARLFSIAYRMLNTRADAEAFCIDMQGRDRIKHNADPRHLNAVADLREAPFFGERERAALPWAKIVSATVLSDANDGACAKLLQHFSDTEIADLGFTIAAIYAWNLLKVSFRKRWPEAT
jgi:alkylhydroperoxidase family enzyme